MKENPHIHNSPIKSTESIISTMKAFGIEANDTMSIIDKYNEVGRIFADIKVA